MNKKAIAPQTDGGLERMGGLAFFIATIAVDISLGINAAVKVVGAACVVIGIIWIGRRAIPIGIEGRAPSFYLRGRAAILSGIAMIAFGIALLLYSAQAAYLLGWAEQI